MQFNFKLKLYRHQDVMVEAIDENHAKEQINRQMNSQKQLFEYVDESEADFGEWKETVSLPTTGVPAKKRKYTKKKKK